MSGKIQILEFNLNTVTKNPSILIIAKRGSGKSFLSRDLIYHFRNNPGGIVISPTDSLNTFYRYFFPDSFIHYDAKDTILDKIIARQKKIMRNTDVDPSAIVVFDDCISSKQMQNSNNKFVKIFTNGQKHCLTTILTAQTPQSVTSNLRTNADYILLLKEDSEHNKGVLWKNYGTMFATYEDFVRTFDECTANYGTMVIDNKKSTSNIQEKVFWFKSKDRTFDFGSEEFNNLHLRCFNPRFAMNLPAPKANLSLKANFFAKLDPVNMFGYFINPDKIREQLKLENDDSPVVPDELNMFNNEPNISDDESSILYDELRTHNDEPNISDDDTSMLFDEPSVRNDKPRALANPSLKIAYSDDTYQLSATLLNLSDHKLVQMFCEHIVELKRE